MNYQTVSTVTKKYGISSRMLSYYEQTGLIQSQRVSGYPYRVFDDVNIKRLQQVVILRKLQIPVKQVAIILNNPDAAAIIEIFQKNIQSIDSEITALSTIRDILLQFLEKLEHITSLNLKPDFLSCDALLELTNPLYLVQKNVKEAITMNELNQAIEALDTYHAQESKEMSMKPEAAVAMIFDGNCRQAMEFYAKVFNSDGMIITTYREIPQDPSNPLSESEKDRVAVGFLQIYELRVKFFDSMPASITFGEAPFAAGNNVIMHLEIMNHEEAKRVFRELSQGGAVLEEWPEPFYAAFNGITKDKYGVVWNILGH